MKKKIILTIAFVISLLPMLSNQYGGMKGVQEISGLINLYNPIGIISVLFFIIGVWIPFKNKKINKIFGGLGVVGIVISEIYNFFTWHIMNITGKMSIHNSIEFAFPEFYVGLVISLIMIAVYFCIKLSMTTSRPSLKALSIAGWIAEASFTFVTPKLLPPSFGFTKTGSPKRLTTSSSVTVCPLNKCIERAISTPNPFR